MSKARPKLPGFCFVWSILLILLDFVVGTACAYCFWGIAE
jgi:hypothetical protein